MLRLGFFDDSLQGLILFTNRLQSLNDVSMKSSKVAWRSLSITNDFPVLNIKRKSFTFVSANKAKGFVGANRKSQFKPDIRIINRNIDEARHGIAYSLFDLLNRNGSAMISIDSVRFKASFLDRRFVYFVEALIEIASIKGLHHKATRHV
jgi:hypothetical protein